MTFYLFVSVSLFNACPESYLLIHGLLFIYLFIYCLFIFHSFILLFPHSICIIDLLIHLFPFVSGLVCFFKVFRFVCLFFCFLSVLSMDLFINCLFID